MRTYKFTDVFGDKHEIQASDLKMAVTAYTDIFHYPEPVKIKVVDK